jgi:hemerythrin superfamily protein
MTMATNPKDDAAAPGGTPRKSASAKSATPKPRSPKAVAATVAESVTGAAADVSHAVEVAGTRVSAARKSKRAGTRRDTGSAPAARSSRLGGTTGAVLGAAAAGLAAGLVANLGRKAAVQAPSVMAGDWFEALKAEHKAALALLDQMAKAGPEQPAKRAMLLMQLKHALGKHAFTEENVIYPALREWGDKADADHLAHDQGYHKQFLYELDMMDKASPEWLAKVMDFRADLDAHIREEEDKIFPQMHAALGEEKNRTLTQAANKEGFKLA